MEAPQDPSHSRRHRPSHVDGDANPFARDASRGTRQMWQRQELLSRAPSTRPAASCERESLRQQVPFPLRYRRHPAPLAGAAKRDRRQCRSLPACRHTPSLVVLRSTEDLADTRWLVVRRRAQAEVIEDPVDRDLIERGPVSSSRKGCRAGPPGRPWRGPIASPRSAPRATAPRRRAAVPAAPPRASRRGARRVGLGAIAASITTAMRVAAGTIRLRSTPEPHPPSRR